LSKRYDYRYTSKEKRGLSTDKYSTINSVEKNEEFNNSKYQKRIKFGRTLKVDYLRKKYF